MPTGYTSDLHDGPQTFQEFALQCARAFGPAIAQRDDERGAPLLVPKVDTSYSDKRLAEAQAELDKYRAIPGELVEREATAAYEAELERWKSRNKEKCEREERYRSMLAEVAGWRAPSDDHLALKEFMYRQLEESIKVDCFLSSPPERMTGEEYRQHKIVVAERDMAYHHKQISEEIERASFRRTWVIALADSLGLEVVDDRVTP